MSLSIEICEQQPYQAVYWLEVGYLPIFFIIQLLLFIHTIYKMLTLNEQISKTLLYLYISLQIIAVIWSILNLMRFAITPSSLDTVSNPTYCIISAYNSRLFTFLFYSIVLLIILLRLDGAFKGSAFEIKPSITKFLTYYILVSFFLTLLIWMFFSALFVPACIWEWDAPDYKDTLYVCTTPQNQWTELTIYISLVWGISLQIVFGCMFTIKLKKVMQCGIGANVEDQGIRNLSTKQTLLSVSTIISTLTLFILWLGIVDGAVFYFLDQILNVIFIGLMFKYNEKYYLICCGICVKCIKSYGAPNKVEMGLAKYSNDKMEISPTSPSIELSI